MKIKLLFFTVLVVVLSCKKVPIYESNWAPDQEEKVITGHDKSYQISWQLKNDEQFLYLDLYSSYMPTVSKILRTGFKFYVDQSNSKSEEFYINYPLKPVKKEVARNERGPWPGGPRDRVLDDGDRSKMRNRMLERMPKEFKLNSLSGKSTENVDSAKFYSLQLQFDSGGTFNYALKFPINDFVKNKVETFTIGLESGAFDLSLMSGMYGGRPGGSRPGGGENMVGSNPMAAQMAEMQDPIKIWFQVNLANK